MGMARGVTNEGHGRGGTDEGLGGWKHVGAGPWRIEGRRGQRLNLLLFLPLVDLVRIGD